MADESDANKLKREPRISVVGLGSFGIETLTHLAKDETFPLSLVGIDTEAEPSTASPDAARVAITHHVLAGGSRLIYDSHSAVELDVARSAIARALSGSELVLIVGTLSERITVATAPLVASLAHRASAVTVPVIAASVDAHDSFTTRDRAMIDVLCRNGGAVLAISDPGLKAPETSTALASRENQADVRAVVLDAVKSIVSLVATTGLVDVDIADLRDVIGIGGRLVIGTGVGHGIERAAMAAKAAVASRWLGVAPISKARGVIVNITGGEDLTLAEVHQINGIVHESVGDEAEILFGAIHEPNLQDEVRVTMICSVPDPEEPSSGNDRTLLSGSLRFQEAGIRPAVAVAWDPEVVDAEEYAEIVGLLGDLCRIEGALSLARIISKDAEVGAHVGVGV